jgi:hypothetical protein
MAAIEIGLSKFADFLHVWQSVSYRRELAERMPHCDIQPGTLDWARG